MTVSIQQLIRFFGLEQRLTDEKGDSDVNDAIMEDIADNTDSTFTPPSCPHCQSNGRVDCAECGEEWMACTCPDVTDTWWCPMCGSTWDQDVLEVGDDDNDYLSGDKLDELIDDIRQQTIEREKNKVAVATFEAGKNSGTSVVEKPSDEVIAKGCQCADPKVYFCMTCHVKRKTSSDPWEWYSDEPTTTTTTTPELVKPSDDVIALGCQCDKPKDYFCPTCHVKRSTLSTPWIWWPHKTQWLATTTTYVAKCRHYELPLVMPDGTIIYGSSKWDRKETDHVPDLGVYLDSMWKPASVAYMIAWPDYGIPTWNDAAIATIQSAYEYAKTGAFVEVGCIGGHGRTGTVLACMAVLGGVNPLEAVKYVHDNYCTEAIESERQEWWIEFFAHSVGLLETLRPVPTVKTYGYGGGHGSMWDYDEWEGSSSGSKVCQVHDHYVDWKAHDTCTCQYWEKDLQEFLEGKFPQNHLELNKKADARVKARLNGLNGTKEEKKPSASSQMLTTGQFNELMCHCGQKYTDCGCTNRTLAKCQHDDCVQYRAVVATAIATEAAETNAAKLDTPEFAPSDPKFVPPVSWVNHGAFGSHNEVAAKSCMRCLHPEGWIRHANYSHSFNYTKDCKQCERDDNAKITVEEAADKVAAEIIKKHDIRSDVRCVRPGCNTFLLTSALTCDKCGLLYSDGFWKSLDPASMEPRVGTVTDGWYYLGPEAGWVEERTVIADEPATSDSL